MNGLAPRRARPASQRRTRRKKLSLTLVEQLSELKRTAAHAIVSAPRSLAFLIG